MWELPMSATAFSALMGMVAGVAVIGVSSVVIGFVWDRVDSLVVAILAGTLTAMALLFGLTLLVPLP